MFNKVLAIVLIITTTSGVCGLPPTTTRAIGDASDLTTFKFQFPNMTVTHTGTTAVFGGGLTTTQKNAIASPTAGMQVFDTTLGQPSYYDGVTWQTGLGTLTVDTDWASCTFASLAWTGVGTVTNNLKCRRQGPNLVMKGKWTAGTVAASIFAMPLPNNYGSLTIDSSVNANQVIGTEWREQASTAIHHSLIASGGGTTLGASNALIAAAINPATPVNGSAVYSTGDVLVISGEISIPISGWSSNASTFSGAGANYSRRAYTPTFTGFGAVTNINCNESRSGEFNDIDCSFTTGTTTAVEARVSLPGTNISSSLGTLRVIGKGNTAQSAASVFSGLSVLTETSVGYVTFGYETSTSNGITKALGTAFPSATNMAFTARIPISGWSNLSQVAASITGYNSTAGVTNPKIFSAQITTTSGVITTNSNLGGVITSCTAANPTVCTLSGITTWVNCSPSIVTHNNVFIEHQSTTTSLTLRSISGNAGADVASQTFDVICHGY